MKNDTKLVEQKSLLAKLMAAENITVEHKKIPTAAFDVKNRVLYLPILKWKPGSDVYDLFCAHEVAHALWTPFEGWHSSVSEKGKGFKSFLNVVEDARIEKKIKRKFAGARSHMIGGYKELMNEDFFGLRSMGVDVNDLGLIDRINLYTKAGTDYGIDFSEEEREWVEKVMRTETFEDVLEVTEALYEYCKENESETDNSYDEFGNMDESDEFGEDEESEGSDGSGDESEMNDFDMDMAGDDSEEMDSEKDGTSGSGSEGEDSDDSDSGLNSFEKEVKDAMDKMREENESKSGDSSDDSSDKTEGKTSDGFEGGTGNPFDRQEMSGPTSLTDDNFREREEDMADMRDSVTVPNYLTFPKLNTDSFIIDYKKVHKEIGEYYVSQEGATEYGRTLLKKFKSANEKMIGYMVKEFEMKKAADIHRRAYSSKKGTLDMNKIHAYKYSENLFQQITSFPEGKNHGMVMFIDWSGSMSGCMKDTIEQLVNLTMFCQKVQIPFEVYAFSDSYRDWQDEDNEEMYRRRNEIPYDTSLTGKKIASYKTNDMIVSQHTKLLNLFSSRMRNRELTDAYENVLMIADAFSNRYSYYYSSSYQFYGIPNNYNLGGTPLDDTIIMSKSIIEEFKIRTKAQIVNAVLLTDGQSNRNGHYLDSTNVVRGFDRRALHIDDKASRSRTYPVSDKGRQKSETDILLEALKNSLGINLLGFFLLSGSGRRVSGSLGYIMSSYPTEVELSQFRKDKFLIDKGTSYDELYILNIKGLEIDEVDHFDSVQAGSSKAEIRKALKKNTKNKLKNRVLLNAFIEKVA